jgi:hypothetical protein
MVRHFAGRRRKIRAEAHAPWLDGIEDGQALQADFVGSILEIRGIKAILA